MELVGIGTFILIIIFFYWLNNDIDRDLLQRFRSERSLHIDWDIAMSEQVIDLLPSDRLGAIRNYSQIASVSADEAERVIDHLLINMTKAKNIEWKLSDEVDGLRYLVKIGEIERAVAVYCDYHGVDEYSARKAIQKIENEQNNDYLFDDDGDYLISDDGEIIQKDNRS
ncbi:MAG: hypothetical protein AAF846_25435 [Chloroflexota bacterium]